VRSFKGVALVLLAAAAALPFAVGEDANVELSGERQGARMDVYKIRPGSGVGPVQLGMSRDDAKRAMGTTGHKVESFDRWQRSPPVLAMQENSFQVYFDGSDRVEAIELMGPSSDGQSFGDEPPFAAHYGDVDVFRTRASELADVVSRDADPDKEAEDHGVAFTFPTIGISLWREGTEDTPFFETVSVFSSKRS
jgi:hypothetical protein